MNWSTLNVLLIFVLSACTSVTAVSDHAYSAGYERLRIQRGERPVAIDLWYPVSETEESTYRYGLSIGSVARSAQVADKDYPLVLLSPGAFGSASNYSWIAEALARNGFIVAGASHFGEAYDYGPETIRPEFVSRFDLRVADMSAVLNFLLADKRWAHSIDESRIAFLGHSSGGATAALSVGAVADLEQLWGYCQTDAGARDKSCGYGKTVPERAELPTYDFKNDGRIKKLVLLDPAIGPAMNTRSLQSISVPVLVFGAVNNDFLPFKAHAERYARTIPGARLEVRGGHDGHFIFLDECDQDIDVLGVKLCEDREGASRAVAHDEMVPLIVDFLATQ